jgi:hypothetical protein
MAFQSSLLQVFRHADLYRLVAGRLAVHENAQYLEGDRRGWDPAEGCERWLLASPPFLLAPAKPARAHFFAFSPRSTGRQMCPAASWREQPKTRHGAPKWGNVHGARSPAPPNCPRIAASDLCIRRF